jgi:CubicO group peptidase (beta-lactamase class C family)
MEIVVMRNRLLAVMAALFLLPVSCAKTKGPEFAAAMDAFCVEHHFNGSILVAEGGKIIFSGGYGYADTETGLRNGVGTAFKIASITKQFTAACALLLRERGLLDLDDPVSKFLDDYPNGEDLRIVHLLSHTSGIAEYSNVAFLGRANRPFTPEELIKYFKDKPLRFPPGTQLEYSNSNYILLGAIIERVSLMPYGAFLQENIFTPLGMRKSSYGMMQDQAVSYLRLNGRESTPGFPLDASATYASGGVVSTVEDLFKWDRSLYGEALLKRESIDLMFKSPYAFSDYGLGWRIEKPGRRPIVQHSGSINGGASHIYRDTRRERTIIILSNVQDADLTSLRAKVLEELDR